jgi:hypothetical protein
MAKAKHLVAFILYPFLAEQDTRQLPYTPAIVHNVPARIGQRYPHGARIAWAQGRIDNDDLHPHFYCWI